MPTKEEILNRIANLPAQQKMAVVAGIVVSAIGFYWFLVHQGQRDDIDALKSELVKLEQSLTEKQTIANNLSRFRREVERLNQELKDAVSLLPNEKDIPQLLTKIAELSEKSGLFLDTFTLRSEVAKGFYAEVPVEMKVMGSFHEIAVFFDKLAKLPRIINVSNLALSKPVEKNQKIILDADFKATTFRFVQQGAQEGGGKK